MGTAWSLAGTGEQIVSVGTFGCLLIDILESVWIPDMLEHFGTLDRLKAVYYAHKWTRPVLCAGVFGIAILLSWLSGGFPPWAWRFLTEVIPRVPRLWQQRGSAIVLPLVGLIVLSVTLFIAWGTLLLIGMRITHRWRREQRELKRFDEDLQGAQRLADTLPPQQESLSASLSPEQQAVTASSRFPATGTSSSPAMFKYSGLHAQNICLVQTPVIARGRAKTLVNVDTYKEQKASAYPLPGAGNLPQRNGLRMVIATGLDSGITRKGKPNEDSLFAFQNTRPSETGPLSVGLFVVADGMGGHGNGQEASRLAIKSLRDTVVPVLLYGPGDDTFAELLAEGVHHANLAVHQRNRQKHADMGTTLTAALVIGTSAYVVNVGDSRTYLYRSSTGLSQITRDHSVVARLVEAGAIAPDEVYTHPKRNEIYRSLGRHATEEIDKFTVSLQIGDALLLCSDGLWEMVHDSDIEKILETSLPYASQTCTMLVQAALNRGGKDNVSVVVVCIKN